MPVTAEELGRRTGSILQKAMKEEVIINSYRKPVVVMIPYATYLKLKRPKKAA